MKDFLCFIGGITIAIIILVGLSFTVTKLKGQNTMTIVLRLPQLTQLSSREWIDLSKVSYIQLPVYIPAPGCTDCATRWGARIIIDGSITEYSEEAEVELRKLLNVK